MGLGKASEAEKSAGLVAESGVVPRYAACWSRPVQTGRSSGRDRSDRVCVSMSVVAYECTRVRAGARPGQMPLSTR